MILFNNLNYYFISNVIFKLNGKSMLWNKSNSRKTKKNFYSEVIFYLKLSGHLQQENLQIRLVFENIFKKSNKFSFETGRDL